jgi:hypothetical protein
MPNCPRYPRPQALNGLSGSSASRRYADGLITVHEVSLGPGACLPIKAATFSAARPGCRHSRASGPRAARPNRYPRGQRLGYWQVSATMHLRCARSGIP